jgi:dienelactone hydrolase
MTCRRFLCSVVLLAATYAATQSTAPRVVTLKATDGTPLKASYFAAAKPGPGVLLLHQCNRQRKVWDDLASRLAASGLNVLTVDYRSFGESGGTPFNQLDPPQQAQMITEKWPGDMDVAFRYLTSQPGVKRETIGAGGASCGVNQSIQLARRHPEVKSLVLLSGNTNRDGKQFLRQSAKLPVFISAADDDDGVVPYMRWLLSLSANPGSTFQRYSAGGHGTDMFAAHNELPGMIVSWFDTTLLKTPGRAPASSAASRPPSKETAVLDLIDQPGGASKVAQMLAQARERDPKAVLFPENIVNLIGYEHLQAGDNKGAVEILKLNATAFPNSANVYDSLSDAYLADGQNDLARQNAEKALQALASDTRDPEDRRKLIKASAEQKLKQLNAGTH